MAGPESRPGWARRWLLAAGAYNIVWGVLVIVLPNALFDVVDIDRPRYPEIWQCVGMIVGVYGIGYLVAARDPLRHWPIVLVGLLGKVFGPIGFLSAVVQGRFPWSFGVTILTNDLIWWVPFTMILARAWREHRAIDGHGAPLDNTNALATATTNTGATIAELSRGTSVLLVCLRHLGCTFCRETLADLRRLRDRLDGDGVQIVLVHMMDADAGASVFARYGLADVPHVSDPDRRLYRALDLYRGSLWQLLGPSNWWRGFLTTMRGHIPGPLRGDGFQMPGVFLVRDGRVQHAFRHRSAGERPDYCSIAGITPAG